MFQTIEQTLALMSMSWGVLKRDRELIVFPLLTFLAVAAVLGAFAGVAYGAGTLDRFIAAGGDRAADTLEPADWVFLAVLYLSVTFTGIFFNAALVAAALERLRGGNPTLASGLGAAAARWPAILGWAVIATTVGLLLQAVRERTPGFLGRLITAFVEGVWAYVTFFVVPVLVAEGVGPIEAIRRSGTLFRRSWGQQVTAAFGFGLVYFLATIAALAVSVAAFAVHVALGIPVAVFAFAIALGTVSALEGIFKAALYDFASGGSPQGFDRDVLAHAYRAL